jgi:hypothetical protein
MAETSCAAVDLAFSVVPTWPQVVLVAENSLAEPAQVNGGVREWQECQVQEEVTPAQSPSP